MERLTDKRFAHMDKAFYQPKSKDEEREIRLMEKPDYDEIYCKLAEYENKIEKGQCVILPEYVILNDYCKDKITKLSAEEVKFVVGDLVYKIYDTVLHFANKPPKKPKYKLVCGKIKNIYHTFNEFHNCFYVRIEVVINDKGHYHVFDQSNMFLDKKEAEQKFKELKGE